MTKKLGQVPVQQPPRPPSKDTSSVAERMVADKPLLRKPIGPVRYTIEKGANVWPGLK